jgi:tryptophanyl-tRNA synthetase
MYTPAVEVAKRITFSTAKAVFGFEHSNNLGEIWYTAMQSAPAYIPTLREGKPSRVLIPHAIDQDPHFRVTRDVAEKIGFPKPAAIHNKFLPGLGKDSKMSASVAESCIFAIDDDKTVKKKVMNMLTGGRESVEEQKKLGGDPDNCTVYKYDYYLFEKDDKKLKEICEDCKAGKLMCGEHKQRLYKSIITFMEAHRKKREKAKDMVEQFMVRD